METTFQQSDRLALILRQKHEVDLRHWPQLVRTNVSECSIRCFRDTSWKLQGLDLHTNRWKETVAEFFTL